MGLARSCFAVGVVVFLACATADATVKHLRGVQDAYKEHFATLTNTFQCIDGQGSVPASHVNDEFCDCADGSDEPGSSACTLRLKKPTNWKFRCTNNGFAAKEVPHSRVNDRICDCCDGSDEYHGFVSCKNVCAEAAEAEEREAREREATRQAGLKARQRMVERAKAKKEQKRAELDAAVKAVEELDAQMSTLESEKDTAEAKERAEREEIHEKSKLEHETWKAEKQKKQEEAEATSTESSGDEDPPNVNDAAGTAADGTTRLVCSSWRQTGGCRGDGDREPSQDKACDATIESGLSGYCACIDSQSGEERTFPMNCGHRTLTCATVCENNGVDVDEAARDSSDGKEKEEEFVIDDGSSFQLEEAREARRKLSDAKSERDAKQRSVDELRKFVGGNYGPEDALLALVDECVEKDDGREYVYKLCPFSEVTQNKRGGYGATNMGRWKGWGEQTYSSWGSKQDYSRMIFEGGDHCYSAGARKTEVHVVCGPESKVVSIEEPSMCRYKMLFETPGVCE